MRSTAGKPPSSDAVVAPKPPDGRATLIATVPDGTFGPYIGYGSDGAMTLYAPPDEERGRRWLVQPLDDQGAPISGPLDIGRGLEDVPFAVVRAVDHGYVALWVHKVHKADVLEGVLLKKDGSLAGTVSTISQAQGQVVWADAFATTKGPIVLWAERTGDRANLRSVLLDDEGAAKGNNNVLAKDVRAWEAISVDAGVAIALVVAAEKNPTLGSVVLVRLDAEGQLEGKPIPISKGATAQLDVGIVRTDRSLVLAWTDRSHADSLVHAATTDLNGRLTVAPRAPLPPLGDQALVTLVAPSKASPDQALLVYEELPSASRGARELSLVTLSAEAIASERAVRLSFSPVGQSRADFSATDDGFVLLTEGPVCESQKACSAQNVPWYLRIGSNLSIDAGGPLLVDALEQQPPTVVWSPGCTAKACVALAAGSHDPASVVTAKLLKGPLAPGAPLHRAPASAPPRPTSNRAVVTSAEPVSDLDAVSVGETTFVGWVTHFAEGLEGSPNTPPPGAPGDPQKPMAAQLAIQRMDQEGVLIEGPTTISVRAMSAGGVAMAPNTKADEICVAWTARDSGDPQLFLTRLGTDGKRKLQRMMTRAKGDAADAALAPHGDGWIVAWVDWRDGNGEVYVTRVNSMLVPLGPERRITDADGDASDVSLLVVGDEVLVAYGDSRDHPTHAMANPFVQKLSVSNLQRIGDERRVATSEVHARGVRLARADDDVVMSWLTRSASDGDSKARVGARVTRLDVGTLRAMGDTNDLRASGSEAPTSLGFACQPGACHGVMIVPFAGGASIEGVSWFPSKSEVRRGRLAKVGGPTAADVAPAVLNNVAFFVDRGVEGGSRIRRVQIEWVKD